MVLNNRDLNQVTWEQRILAGDRKFTASQDIPDFPYARFAESIGLRGIRVDRPEEVGNAWDQALSSDHPVILEAIVDPDVPALPPHITLKQAKGLMATIYAGDPNEAGIIKQAAKGMMERVLH